MKAVVWLSPARLHTVDLGEAGRVDDDELTTFEVSSPAEFEPDHVGFARKVPLESNRHRK